MKWNIQLDNIYSSKTLWEWREQVIDGRWMMRVVTAPS